MATTPTLLPLVFLRQQAEPVDVDTVFATTAERMAYLSSPRGYRGLVAYDDETKKLYFLSRTAANQRIWVEIATGTNSGQLTTDYDYHILGSRDSSNKTYMLRNPFQPGSTRVYVNGVRYTMGGGYDYVESSDQTITFTHAPDAGDLITVDYIVTF